MFCTGCLIYIYYLVLSLCRRPLHSVYPHLPTVCNPSRITNTVSVPLTVSCFACIVVFSRSETLSFPSLTDYTVSHLKKLSCTICVYASFVVQQSANRQTSSIAGDTPNSFLIRNVPPFHCCKQVNHTLCHPTAGAIPLGISFVLVGFAQISVYRAFSSLSAT